MMWARTTSAPVTTERRVRVFTSTGSEGWAIVKWTRGGANLNGPVVSDDDDVIDDSPKFSTSSKYLPEPEPFPVKVRELREAVGLSVAALAEAAGLSRQTIHQYEAGERRPTWDAVQAIAKALNTSTDTFRDK
jgi:DNA-binding XRE family transcriptional regulator